MYKYLYGKWEYLKDLVEGNGNIRLCDIRHYARLENENMQDTEEIKHFEFISDSIRMFIGEHEINPQDVVSNLKFDMPVRPCFCICFSNKKNDLELFDKFKADVCIEFNVEYLIEFLKHLFEEKFGGKVVAGNVKYYEINAGLESLPAEEAVFTKPLKYKHEDEFRIAAFLPYDAETLININEQSHQAFKECRCADKAIKNGDCSCYFAFLHNGLQSGFKTYVSEVKKLTNATNRTY